MSTLRTCLVFAFCCLISGISGVFADDFFVDAVNGSDETGDGSEQNPWKRLQFAFNSIEGTPENPHMIYLFPGRYDETLNGEFRVFSDSYESVCGLDRDNVFLFNLRIEHEGGVTVKDATVRFIDIEYGQNNLVSNCVFNGGISPSLYVVNSGYAQVESCTFTGTGKIKCIFEGHLFIRNCVYAGNFEAIETDSSSELEITYSYIENGWPGTGNISGGSDPGFVVPNALDFRLRAGSVCIDAGDPSDPVPPGGGSRIDMGCYEYQHKPQLFIESVNFAELSGDGDGIPETGETIQPEITLCNYGEPATGMTVTYTLNHPDITMIQSQVSVGDMAFDECRTVAGPTFSVSGPSGWCLPVDLTGDWISGTDTGTYSIPFSLHGIEMHVDPETGSNDTGTGSSSNPFKTIGFARDRCRGSRLYPLTIRAHAGVYSNETNGETWPLYLDEYEDLAGDGDETMLWCTLLTDHDYIYPSRTSDLSNFSLKNTSQFYFGIWAHSLLDPTYSRINTTETFELEPGLALRGSSVVTINNCAFYGFSSGDYESGDQAIMEYCSIYGGTLTGNVLFQNSIVESGDMTLNIFQNPGAPGNVIRFNTIHVVSNVSNVNEFSDNTCRGLVANTNTSYDIMRNVCVDSAFWLFESEESINLIDCIAVEFDGSSTSHSYYSDTGPGWNCINCINLPYLYNIDADCVFKALYSSFTVDGCTALFNRAGIDFYYCASTRNTVSYYNHRDASDCWNTRYSDMVNCPDPDNIDADPGFIGISTITDIGFNWFADNTAAWEPDRYTGYYVNPNIFNNDALFYCIGNTEDTIYVMGDPRTAAKIGDRFVIPDLRLRRIADGFAYDSPLIDTGDPAETDPDGSRRDIGPYGGPYARTPMPVIPTWPPPAHTPTPPPTETPTITPTATPRTTGVKILMPDNMFYPGDTFWCTVSVLNDTPEPLTGYPLFVILDVYGDLFFAPSFNTAGDAWPGPWLPGETNVSILEPFTWPETGSSANGIWWYAALTNPDVTQIYGEWDAFEFGWGSA